MHMKLSKYYPIYSKEPRWPIWPMQPHMACQVTVKGTCQPSSQGFQVKAILVFFRMNWILKQHRFISKLHYFT